jgi:hypothetical protein
MKGKYLKHLTLNAVIILIFCNITSSQNISDFVYKGTFDPSAGSVKTDFQFNGYTNYWHDIYRDEIRYGNLFKQSIPDVQMSIAQAELILLMICRFRV